MLDDFTYVGAFNEISMQFTRECANDIHLLDGISISSSYAHIGQIMPFLQNFMIWSIFILM